MPEYEVLNIPAADLEQALNHLASEWTPVLFSTTAAGGNNDPRYCHTRKSQEIKKGPEH
jgi:hypothetical protein